MKVVLFIILSFCLRETGGNHCEFKKPTTYEFEFKDAYDCIRESNFLTIAFYELRKAGQFQAGCVVIGPDSEAKH